MDEGLSLQLQDIFFTYILPALALILTTITSWVGTVIVKYLTDKRDDRKLKEALERANKEIMNAVSAVMQSFVNSLKEDGRWTPETEQEARDKAFLAAKSAIGPLMWRLLEVYFTKDGVSVVDQWCYTQIDALVEPIKKVRADRKLAEEQLKQLQIQCETKA
jgi:hypothetical protein